MPEVKQLQGPAVLAKIHDVSQTSLPPGTGSGDFIVDGTESYDGWFLKAERLIFKTGATLFFSRQAQEARRSFFIIVRELVCEDQQHPGSITWERPSIPGNTPLGIGQAPTGVHATADDSPGGPGQAGQHGLIGLSGNSAPAITLITANVPSSGAFVDLTGQKGGDGGQGQKGGDGGNGAKGHPASSGAFDCKNGAGNGGAGGPGGPGGPGGQGGKGGVGGSFTLLVVTPDVITSTQKFRVDVSGGPAGSGGSGGAGGQGGIGGQRGEKALPWCKDDGSAGANGPVGPSGSSGPAGETGVAGDFFVGTLTQQIFDSLF